MSDPLKICIITALGPHVTSLDPGNLSPHADEPGAPSSMQSFLTALPTFTQLQHLDLRSVCRSHASTQLLVQHLPYLSHMHSASL